MDDLYNNAWGEPAKQDAEPPITSKGTGSSWVSPKLSQDDEADLAAPSWSTGAGIQWNEPQDSHGFAWSQSEPDFAWGSSVYDTIQIGKTNGAPVQEERAPSPLQGNVEEDAATPTASPSQSPAPSPRGSPSPTPPPTLPEPVGSDESLEHSPISSRAESPDAFGTFASAFDSESAQHPLSPGLTPDLGADAWGSAWETSPEEDIKRDNEVTTEDEWEVAKKAKEVQDRQVPPEVLADIHAQLDEFCRDLWPEPKLGAGEEDKSFSDWRNGMEGVDGLEYILEKYLPPLTLQPPVRFKTTAIARNLATTLRVTKNLPSTRASPFSHYMAAKGSTAWETSVKTSKDVDEDDVVPVGWKMVEKASTVPAEPTKAQKTSGRLFSFWGRRDSKRLSTSTPPLASVQEQPALPTTLAETESAEGSEAPPVRSSVDSVKSTSTRKGLNNDVALSSASSPPVSATRNSTPAPFVPFSESPTPSIAASSIGSYGEGPPDSQLDRAQTPPPSAVSRFLNRFSRKRSIGTHSPQSSVALSSDDLEFLSDIVPSANDDHDSEPSLEALSNMMKPEPLPPILPPPPAPPPIATSHRLHSPVKAETSPSSSSAVGLQHKPPASAQSEMDEFDSFLSAFEAGPSNAVAGSSALPPSLALLEPTPASATSSSSSSPGWSPSSQIPPAFADLANPNTKPASPSPLSMLPPPSKPSNVALQPFALPPPPASRSQTASPFRLNGLSPPPAPNRSASETNVRPTSRSSLPARSKLPSFILPPPQTSQPQPQYATSSATPTSPTLSSRSASPSSALPLSELYPGAATGIKAGAWLNTGPEQPVSRSSSPFLIPPPPSSHSHAPMPAAASRPKTAAIAPLLPPPSAPPIAPRAQHAAAPVATSNIFDDDDFADFQSSSTATEPLPSSTSATQHMWSPTSPSALLSQTSPAFAPLSPPPLSTSASLLQPARSSTLPPLASLYEDDFADFQSPSQKSLHPPPSSDSSPFRLDTSFSSSRGLLTPQKRSAGFDGPERAHGTLTTLDTPSPPRLPAKPSPPPSSLFIAPPPSSSNGANNSPSTKQAREARHMHTLSLMERAAARPGQWPAPPSPLPQAISFPGPNSNSGVADLMGDDESFGSFGAVEAGGLLGAGMGASSSEPAMLRPSQTVSSVGSGSERGLLGLGGSTSTKTDGKLSANDLSFFEGL